MSNNYSESTVYPKETEEFAKDLLQEAYPGYKDPKEYVVANCKLLNLRESPSMDSNIILELSVGCIVVGDRITDSGWMHVVHKLPNQEIAGYVMTDFVKEV